MRVIHLNFSDTQGGAARCAYRIHRALSDHMDSVESQLWVVKKATNDPTVHAPYSPLGQKFRSVRGGIDRTLSRLTRHDNYPVHSLNLLPTGLLKKIQEASPDVIHLHWISGAMLSLKEIANIPCPIVWTLHDFWPILGSRHYPEALSPEKIINEEGAYLSPNRWSRKLYAEKARLWKDCNMTFVSQCAWSHAIATRSKVSAHHKHALIGCPLDKKEFYPFSEEKRSILRQQWGFSPTDKVLLIGNNGALTPRNAAKGFPYLFEALHLLKDQAPQLPIKLLTVGNDSQAPSFPFPTTSLGYVDSDRLACAYNAADIVAVPSVMETFGQSMSEPLACGTPVVAFDATSQKDIVLDGQTGYLAAFPDVEDFAKKLEKGLLNAHQMRHASAKRAATRWNSASIAHQYASLYP